MRKDRQDSISRSMHHRFQFEPDKACRDRRNGEKDGIRRREGLHKAYVLHQIHNQRDQQPADDTVEQSLDDHVFAFHGNFLLNNRVMFCPL